MVDKIIENLEMSLGKLGENLRIDKIEGKKEKLEEKIKTEEKVKIEKNDRAPFASVRYPTPDNVLVDKPSYSQSSIKENEYIPIPIVPITNTSQETANKPKEVMPDDSLEVEEIESDLVTVGRLQQEGVYLGEISEDFFLDIPKEIRLIHLFGPPGSAKTTIGLQTAIEITPKNAYYFITSHATSTLKRVKQIIENNRWSEYQSFKQSFFPIEISNLDVLEVQLEKIEDMNPEEVGLIIIDHLTDYSRGEIYKEEKRKQLRNLLERLYILADEKKCKILIINGYSFKGSAPAEDIVESFCDMTIHTKIEDYQVKLFVEDDEIPLEIDDSGVKNLHVNVYF